MSYSHQGSSDHREARGAGSQLPNACDARSILGQESVWRIVDMMVTALRFRLIFRDELANPILLVLTGSGLLAIGGFMLRKRDRFLRNIG